MNADDHVRRLERFERDVLVYVSDLYRAALRLTSRRSDAEDLVQETCLRAFECLDQLKHPPAAKVWVFTILRSIFLRQTERASSRPAFVSLDDVDASRLTAGEALQDGFEPVFPARPTLVDEVRRAISNLPLAYREAIILAHIAGFSYREMAQILGVPLGTVMSRLFRARRMLRLALRECRSPAAVPR